MKERLLTQILGGWFGYFLEIMNAKRLFSRQLTSFEGDMVGEGVQEIEPWPVHPCH